MLRDRYDPLNLFDQIPALGMQTDAVLAQLDMLLDDDELFQAVKHDLSRRYPRTTTFGRPATPVEVVLRLLVVKHLYNWSYAQTEQWVSDSLVLRQFCRVYTARVPDDTTLLRWAKLIHPATLQHLLNHVVALACQQRITRGRKLRLDSTVVETNIRYPVDSTLLADGVRVLARTIRRAKPLLAGTVERARTVFRDRTRSVRRVTRQLIDAARRRGEQATQNVQAHYQQLLDLTQQVVQQAQQVQQDLQTRIQQPADCLAQRLATTLQTVVPRVEQIITQTTRRVMQGETVPATEKLVSVFEPHTAIIRKGKAGKPVEFGRVLWLGEAEGGIITQARAGAKSALAEARQGTL
jgi:IS5 family transposase